VNTGWTYKQLVEDIVRDIFTALDTDDSIEEGGFGSQREVAEDDLKGLSREELLSDIEQTERFLSTVWTIAAELDNLVAMTAVADAQQRVEAALERVKEAYLR
jgi:hypothetical protein